MWTILTCLSSVVWSISNTRLSISSSAARQTWYCSGRCSVTYSLMDSLAYSRRYCTSEVMEAFDTCSSRTISWELKPLDLSSMTLLLRRSDWSVLCSIFQCFPFMNIKAFGFLALSVCWQMAEFITLIYSLKNVVMIISYEKMDDGVFYDVRK